MQTSAISIRFLAHGIGPAGPTTPAGERHVNVTGVPSQRAGGGSAGCPRAAGHGTELAGTPAGQDARRHVNISRSTAINFRLARHARLPRSLSLLFRTVRPIPHAVPALWVQEIKHERAPYRRASVRRRRPLRRRAWPNSPAATEGRPRSMARGRSSPRRPKTRHMNSSVGSPPPLA